MSEDDDFARFLESARADHVASSLPPETTQRIDASVAAHVSWRRRLPAGLAAALATTTGAAAARNDGGEAGSTSSKSGLPARGPWGKALAVVVPVVGLAFLSYSATTTRAPAPSGPVVSATPTPVVVDPSVASDEDPPVLARPGDLPDVRDLPDAPPNRPSKPASSHGSNPSDGTLEAELALLAQVSSALQAGRPGQALALVEAHARRFPKGVLVPEFAAQRVLALAALGRHAEACAHSARFLAMYPKSSLVPEVRSSCVDPTSSR